MNQLDLLFNRRNVHYKVYLQVFCEAYRVETFIFLALEPSEGFAPFLLGVTSSALLLGDAPFLGEVSSSKRWLLGVLGLGDAVLEGVETFSTLAGVSVFLGLDCLGMCSRQCLATEAKSVCLLKGAS